jgi:Spy/CpxP family protein refolding chaperone
VNTWKVILATMVIFATGVVTGGLLVRHSDHIRPARPAHQTNSTRPLPPLSTGGIKLEFLRRVQRELDLSPEQREQADKVISASQERVKKLMEPVSPKLREEFAQTKEEFRAVLTPDQKARFDELLKQQQRPRDPRRTQPGREHLPESGLPIEGSPKR